MLHPVLNTPESRRALASRDIATVYRLLKQHGVSQRAIGYATGQSQSEVSEIIAGRPVLQAHVLERIADGLGVDRGGSVFHTVLLVFRTAMHPPSRR